jgi:6-pyruvoyltetrahydropterin/6-carboxytetrahydropterin synthase
MYTVAVTRDFIAQHYLIGGDWGAENSLHSHHYIVEVSLHGQELDQHGYLVDIVEIESCLEALVERFRDRTLNDLASFAGENPSVERFAAIFCHAMSEGITAGNVTSITVKMWENDIAWASYQLERR